MARAASDAQIETIIDANRIQMKRHGYLPVEAAYTDPRIACSITDAVSL